MVLIGPGVFDDRQRAEDLIDEGGLLAAPAILEPFVTKGTPVEHSRCPAGTLAMPHPFSLRVEPGEFDDSPFVELLPGDVDETSAGRFADLDRRSMIRVGHAVLPQGPCCSGRARGPLSRVFGRPSYRNHQRISTRPRKEEGGRIHVNAVAVFSTTSKFSLSAKFIEWSYLNMERDMDE
jgi:hypothetical protein